MVLNMGSENETRYPTARLPRRRAALACSACRVRKTRCDARRPSCSLCVELEIECIYQRPSTTEKEREKDSGFSAIIDRLDRIECAIEDLSPAAQTSSHKETDDSTPFSANGALSASPSSASFGKSLSKMPNLLMFNYADFDQSSLAYNTTSQFYRDQMETEMEWTQAMQGPLPDMNLSQPHLWELQRSFADNILKWLPILSPHTATEILSQAEALGYQDPAMSTSIALLIFAVGSIAADPTAYVESSPDLPGFEYYCRGFSMLRTLASPLKILCKIQGKVLAGTYLLFAIRPLLAWRIFNEAAHDCLIILKTTKLSEETPEFRDTFSRIFWICYALGHELEVCLEMPSSGVRAYEALVPLPSSEFEEEGLYYLFAVSSLRKLMMEVVDTVGLNSSASTQYAPIVMIELRKQVEDWKNHLPSFLRFPITQSRLFDSRRAHLRCQYYALIAVVTWPFVIQCQSVMARDQIPIESYRLGASECLDACKAYLESAEEILTHKSLQAHLVIRGFFSLLMILIIAFPVTPENTKVEDHRGLLKQAIRNLNYWRVVPFTRASLLEMERIARLQGILDEK